MLLNGQSTCYIGHDSFGTISGPFGPFSTFSSKNWCFTPKTPSAPWPTCFWLHNYLPTQDREAPSWKVLCSNGHCQNSFDPPTVYHKGGLGYSSPILGSAQNFLFNLQTEFHTIWMSKSHNIFEYLVKAYKSGIGYACIKEERKFNGTRPPSTPHTNGPLFQKSGQIG